MPSYRWLRHALAAHLEECRRRVKLCRTVGSISRQAQRLGDAHEAAAAVYAKALAELDQVDELERKKPE
jgi:cbb3-type cytochrome oxidase cytochrome c subunit